MAELDGPRRGPASRGGARQLVVLCHGVGADGRDLIDLAGPWSKVLPDAAFVAPNAPFPYEMAPEFGGRQWFSLADLTPAAMEAGAREAAPFLFRFLDTELERLGLPPEAYALAGFSQGAMMALFTGLRRKVAPRAIVSFSGALIAPHKLLSERQNRAPVLLVHGEADNVVPAYLSRYAEWGLRAGGISAETLFLPMLGHSIGEAAIAAGADFLGRAFSQTAR